MLYNQNEVQVMSRARQPGMRQPGVSTAVFEHIYKDFLSGVGVSGLRVLDVGPGQWDMLDILRQHGAETVGVDNDPAVYELGRLRGHEALIAELTQGWPFKEGEFDGIFCRGSINLFWFNARESLHAFLDGLGHSIKEGGWIWVAPWNNPSSAQKGEYAGVMREVTDSWAKQQQIRVTFPGWWTRRKYGIGYGIPRVELWTRFPGRR